MRKFLSIALALCLIFAGLVFSACGTTETSLSGGPAYDDPVYGNGGMVVTKGDYIYFASGYVKTEDIGKKFSNIKGTVANGGLYRAKMIEVTSQEGDNTVVVNTLEQKELMISKIVGFDKGGLYIFKDKLYFSSPSIVKDNTGTRYDLITFYSCNLDGSGLKEFYQTLEYGNNATFSMTMIDEKVYLLVYTGTKIIRVEENGTATEMASDVTDVVFPTRKNIINNEENLPVNENFIYYTKDTKSENTLDLGDTLYKRDIVSNVETELFKQNYIEIDLLEIKSGRLFYARNNESSNIKSYYSNSLDSENFVSSEARHTMSTYSSFVALGEKNEDNLGIAFIFNNKIYIRGLEQGISEAIKTVSASSILNVSNGYIYYAYSSDIYRVDITANVPKSEEVSDDLTPLTSICDVDLEYCYFFVEDTSALSGYSLYRIALDGLADEKSKAEKIG
jgi:hypothetical protein